MTRIRPLGGRRDPVRSSGGNQGLGCHVNVRGIAVGRPSLTCCPAISRRPYAQGRTRETETRVTPRPPLSKRQTQESIEEFFVLREGVPDGLRNSLLGVFDDYFIRRGRVDVERTEHLARLTKRELPQYAGSLRELVSDDPDLLLDAIDHALQFPRPDPDPYGLLERVMSYLDDAGSALRVVQLDGSKCELALRQPPELTEIVAKVTSDRSRASDHLRRAWSHAFARQPDPSAACIEAAKAVEAAALATIEPNNRRATLGTMLKAMEAKPEKWTTVFESSDAGSLETVISMMRMIWKGHLRHGNPKEPIDVSTEQCEMIVHTAALLVQWFGSGRISTV